MEQRDDKVPFPSAPLKKVFVKNGFTTVKARGQTLYGFSNVAQLCNALLSAILLKKGRLDCDEIKYLRLKVDCTQAELASFIGTTEQTYMQWERGDRPLAQASDSLLRLFIIERLKKHLNATVKKLTVEQIAELNRKESNEFEYVGDYTQDGWTVSAIETIDNTVKKISQRYQHESLTFVGEDLAELLARSHVYPRNNRPRLLLNENFVDSQGWESSYIRKFATNIGELNVCH